MAILEEVKRLLPEAEVSNLQALYPNYQIDVTAEQAEKERLEAKLAKVLEDKENAKNSLTGKYADVAFAFNRHISKKQRKFAKTVERGAKRQEKQIKKKLKKLNKRIEEIKKEEIAN